MDVITAEEYLRIAVDPLRLAILGAAAVGPVDAEELAARLATPPRRVLGAVGELRVAGLLTPELTLDREALRELSTSLAQLPPMDPALADGPWNTEEARVLGRFFSGTRLVAMPTQRTARVLVLERLAMAFEPGVKYAEAEVNQRLTVFHNDYALLRRRLVDEGLLSREAGFYWRSGGRWDGLWGGSD
jgi:hypothetical protein